MICRSITLLGLLSSLAAAALAQEIPLCPGLTVVTAITQANGDYESIKTVESAGPQGIRIKYSSEHPDSDMFGTGELKKTIVYRTVLPKDLQTATKYQQIFLEKSDETVPETTAIGTSAAVLKALKAKGEAELTISNAYGVPELTADLEKRPNFYDYMLSGRFKRAGSTRLPVLVNDKLVELPAIHAQGEIVGDKAEFFFLDDEKNPLTLKFRIGIGGIKPLDPAMLEVCEGMKKNNVPFTGILAGCNHPKGGDRDVLRVVKITHRCAGPPQMSGGGGGGAGAGAGTGAGAAAGSGGQGAGAAGGVSALEQSLAETGQADVYSIYFSFNSDAIREESEPTLKEIAEILRRHPDWKLSVNGHTDNVGGDKSNLALSQRRAAAVKDALVKRHRIEASRLVSGGMGESAPKDTNETVEGRARNRRVELVRLQQGR